MLTKEERALIEQGLATVTQHIEEAFEEHQNYRTRVREIADRIEVLCSDAEYAATLHARTRALVELQTLVKELRDPTPTPAGNTPPSPTD